jgi:hypothetical protein
MNKFFDSKQVSTLVICIRLFHGDRKFKIGKDRVHGFKRIPDLIRRYLGDLNKTQTGTAFIRKLTVRNGEFIEFFQSVIIQQVQVCQSVLKPGYIAFFDQVGRNKNIFFFVFLYGETGFVFFIQAVGFCTIKGMFHNILKRFDHYQQNFFIDTGLYAQDNNFALQFIDQIANGIVPNLSSKMKDGIIMVP